MNRLFVLFFVFFFLVGHVSDPLFATEDGNAKPARQSGGKEIDVSEVIMHHVADAHEWHFFTIGEKEFSIPLPVILYSDKGLEVFSFGKFEHHSDSHELTYDGYTIKEGKITADDGRNVYDFSITKNVLFMLVAGIILMIIFVSIAKRYRANPNQVPKGIQGFFEPVVVFIRDDVAKPNIGHKHERYLPFLLTLFFFILFCNLLGLLPSGPNITGNIATTIALASITFFVVQFSGNKNYWGHIFNTPGVPWWLKFGIPLMPLVEVIGIFVKPFALTIRLFANITAGHIVILSLISLIFIFGKGGESMAGGFGVSPLSVGFVLFIMALELFVALLQAYIFTLLSSIYIGAAVEEHHE